MKIETKLTNDEIVISCAQSGDFAYSFFLVQCRVWRDLMQGK